jgi:hypothetical protein
MAQNKLQVLRGGDGNAALFLLKEEGTEFDILQKTDHIARGGFQYGPFEQTGKIQVHSAPSLTPPFRLSSCAFQGILLVFNPAFFLV